MKVPVLSEISIISDNDNVSWGREGDNITLSFTSNETIQTPDLTNISIFGLTDLVFTSLNDNNTRWQVTGTVDEDAVSGSGAREAQVMLISASVSPTRQATQALRWQMQLEAKELLSMWKPRW